MRSQRRQFLIVILLFTTSFLILSVLGIFVMNKFKERTYFNEMVLHTHDVIGRLNDVEKQLLLCETDQRGFLLTGDSIFYRQFISSSKSICVSIDSIATLLRDNPEQVKRVKRLDSLTNLRIAYLKRTSSGIQFTDPMLWSQLIRKGKEVMDELELQIIMLRNAEFQLLGLRNGAGMVAEQTLSKSIILGFAFGLIISISSFIALIRLLRKQIKNEENLSRLNRELQAGISDLQQVSKVFSHDLQEPLRKIRTFLSQYKLRIKGGMAEPNLHILERAEMNAEHAARLVQQLMVYTSLSTRSCKPEMTEVKMLMDEIIHQYSDKIQACGAHVINHLHGKVWMDPAQTKLALEALLSNSLKFHEDGIPPKVVIEGEWLNDKQAKISPAFRHTAHWYVLSVSDWGIGVEDLYKDKIFNIFQRLHVGETVYEGSGIGLAIVRRIASNHFGKVELNNFAQPTVFKIWFPMFER